MDWSVYFVLQDYSIEHYYSSSDNDNSRFTFGDQNLVAPVVGEVASSPSLPGGT